MKDKLSKTGFNRASASRGTSGELAKRLRILVVAPSFDILGGQSVQAARLISRLREVPSFEVGFLPINPRLPGVLRKLQTVKYLRTIVTSLLYIATLLIRVPSYDVLHVFSASYFSFVLAPTPAILLGRLFGKKILLNYHSGEAEDHLRRWPSAVSTIRLVDEVAVPSAYLVKVFKQFEINARAINNIIELNQFTFRERVPLRPLFLSNRNLEAHYGVDHVLRAFARIQEQFPEAQLTVAGDGSQRPALEALARQLELHNTKFPGRIEHDEIVAQYEDADIYLNGSEIDNQPLSLLEAFASGLPVVTTDAGGIPNMVADGASGFVVSRGDDEAIADRALRLLSDSQLARTIALRARASCEQYSWETVCEEWIDLYQRLSSPPPKAHRHSVSQSKSRLRKLSRMSPEELRVRSSQAFAAFAERRGWSRLSKLPTDRGLLGLFDTSRLDARAIRTADDLLQHFRTRQQPDSFPAFVDPEAVVAELRRRWPEAEKQIVAEADRIMAGRFDLPGQSGLSFGDPINWHLEPLSGKSAPMLHWTRIDYLNPDVAGDKKIVWELNRHQHFVTLGQAYWLTKDEEYAAAFVAQLESWMDANPPKLGINWASSLEVAFRSIAWLWAFEFFKDSPGLTAQTLKRALKFLYLHARHLETYPSIYFSPNTHLTGEALGLFYLGTLLPEFKEADRWRRTGTKILIDQLSQQVKPDGVYFEQSSYYHRYTADFYTHFLILAHANGDTSPSYVVEKLKALLDHLMHITHPDGTSPLIGDDDGGRLISLDRRRPNDFRAALSNGAALFERGDYKFVAGELAEETLWLLGRKGVEDFERTKSQEPTSQSRAFPDGGYYVMRDGWHQKSNYLLFDCGPHGANNCGHAHADALAIEVAANGRSLLVDAGTNTYTGSKELREWFRGSSAHNVVLVDDEPSSVPAGPFSWKTTAKCETSSWISERRFDYAEGRHNGFERLIKPVTHSRSILFLKNDYWLLRDRITSQGTHDLSLRLHFAADSNLQLESSGDYPCLIESGRGAGLQLMALGSQGQWSREEGWVSHSYGERVAAPVYVFSSHFTGTEDLITLLLPTLGEARLLVATKEIEAIGGRAFEIASRDHLDLVLIRHPGASRIETVRMVSDFHWTWARFARGGLELPEELLVLDGHRLELDGREILKSSKRVSYLMASRVGNKFRLETNEGVLDLSLPVSDLETLFSDVRN